MSVSSPPLTEAPAKSSVNTAPAPPTNVITAEASTKGLINSSPSILSIAFNQDSDCFICGTHDGFRVHTTEPCKESYHRDLPQAQGVGIAEMYYRSNLIVLVGQSSTGLYLPNKVIIWDDHQKKSIAELEFHSAVKSVRVNRNFLVVFLIDKVYIYNFNNLRLVHKVETLNPNGAGAISLDLSVPFTLACPGLAQGTVQIVTIDSTLQAKSTTLSAHTNPIRCLAMNREATRLATTSERGTVIRLFDLVTGAKIREFRRGTEPAMIYSLAFDLSGTYLAVTSDKGTVHIFNLATPPVDRRLLVPQYFQSEYGFTQFSVPTSRSVCRFVPSTRSETPNQAGPSGPSGPSGQSGHVGTIGTLMVISNEGIYYRYHFDPTKRDGQVESTRF